MLEGEAAREGNKSVSLGRQEGTKYKGVRLLHIYPCKVLMKVEYFRVYLGTTKLPQHVPAHWVTRQHHHAPDCKQNAKNSRETKRQGNLNRDDVD